MKKTEQLYDGRTKKIFRACDGAIVSADMILSDICRFPLVKADAKPDKNRFCVNSRMLLGK